MRKREPPKIKVFFGFKTRIIALLVIGGFLFFKLQNYERVQLSMDQMEMAPAMLPGQNIVLYSHDNPEKYLAHDIIYYRRLEEESFHFARIVAKDRAKIEMRDQNLYVDGVLHKPTKDAIPGHLQKTYELKPGELFIVQDQQGSSWMDSVAIGPMKLEDLIFRGKIFFFMSQAPEAE